jgi:hypothetical protein
MVATFLAAFQDWIPAGEAVAEVARAFGSSAQLCTS